jgi:hypothetical protein
VPGTGDFVELTNSGAAYTVTYNFNTVAPGVTLSGLEIDLTGAAATLLMNSKTAITLISTIEYVGFDGIGNINQSSGSNTAPSDLYLGYYLGSDGTYNIGGGDLTAGTEQLGCGNEIIEVLPFGSGTNVGLPDVSGYNGAISQTGGVNTVNTELDIGAGDTGLYSISGGTLTVNGSAYLGGTSGGISTSATGTFNVSNAAAVTVTGDLEAYSGFSQISLSGGSITTGELSLGGGLSQFNWTGGTLHLTDMQLNFSSTDAEGDNLFGNSLTLNSGMSLQDDIWEWMFGNGATITQNSGSSNSMLDFYLGSNGGSSGNATYFLNGGTFSTTANQYLGYLNARLQGGSGGNGTFNQSGGSNIVGGTLYLGYSSGSEAYYNLAGTGSLSAPYECIGYNAGGIFNQSAGSNNVSSTLFLGYTSSGGGTYILSGSGVLTSAGPEYIGFSGTGVVSQTGGTNTIMSGPLYLSYEAGSSSEYLLSGGTLTATGYEEIGVSGSATASQSGGTNNIDGGYSLIVGFLTGSSGSYSLSGSGLLSCSGNEYVGYESTGNFNQSGGTNNVSFDVILGGFNGQTGTYTLSSGALSAGSFEYIGDDGVAIFNQTGGTNTVTTGGELDVGSFGGSVGTYLLSGGSTTVNGNAYVGGTSSGSGGTGILTVSNSGTLTVAGTLSVYTGSGNIINLAGGSITAGLINFNNNLSQFNWTAGTLSLTDDFVLVDNNTSAENFTNSFKLLAGETLNVVNESEYAGYSGTGKFNNNGGSNTIGASLVIGTTGGSTGTYVLANGGSLNVIGAEFVGNGGAGTFNQTSGTNTTPGGNLYIGYNTAAKGTYLLSGGTANIGGSVDVGGSSTAAGGTGTLTISNTGLMIVGQTLQVWGHGTVNVSGTILSVGGLSIATGGLVNVNSAVQIDYGVGANPDAMIQQYIEGHEISSSFVTANPNYGIAYASAGDPGLSNNHLTVGQAIVEPDLLGDADLNGTVNIHDLVNLLSNFNQPGFWVEGNFLDGPTVDIGDLQALLTNFNSSTTLTYSELTGLENLVGEYGDVAVANPDGVGFTLTSVPEPASAVLLIAGLALNLRRRRTSQSR